MTFKDKLKEECKTLTIEELKDLLTFIRYTKIKDRLIYDKFDKPMVRVF